MNGVIAADGAPACLDVYAWKEDVAAGHTILGFQEWVANMSARRAAEGLETNAVFDKPRSIPIR